MSYKTLDSASTLYGFVAWLSTRKEVVKIGSSENCAGLPQLINAFLKENGLDPMPVDADLPEWGTYPKEEEL